MRGLGGGRGDALCGLVGGRVREHWGGMNGAQDGCQDSGQSLTPTPNAPLAAHHTARPAHPVAIRCVMPRHMPCRPVPRYLDVVPRQAGKLEALNYVRLRYGFPISSTVACGDSGNDILMLSGAVPRRRSHVDSAQGVCGCRCGNKPCRESGCLWWGWERARSAI